MIFLVIRTPSHKHTPKHSKHFNQLPHSGFVQRSLLAFSGYREGEQKFDYFVTGVAGALFAYLATNYTPRKLSISPDSLEPLSLIFLALAFFYGMKRIQSVVVSMRENHDMLDHQERAGNATEAMSSGSSGFNSLSGEMIHFSELPSRREFHMRMAQEARSRVEVAAENTLDYYRRRNMFLYFGFVAILLHKLLIPYA
jgi:hypothetical protein